MSGTSKAPGQGTTTVKLSAAYPASWMDVREELQRVTQLLAAWVDAKEAGLTCSQDVPTITESMTSTAPETQGDLRSDTVLTHRDEQGSWQTRRSGDLESLQLFEERYQDIDHLQIRMRSLVEQGMSAAPDEAQMPRPDYLEFVTHRMRGGWVLRWYENEEQNSGT